MAFCQVACGGGSKSSIDSTNSSSSSSSSSSGSNSNSSIEVVIVVVVAVVVEVVVVVVVVVEYSVCPKAQQEAQQLSNNILAQARLKEELPIPHEVKFALAYYKWCGVPLVLIRLIYMCMANGTADLSPAIYHLEFFSGMQAVTNAYLEQGVVAVPFEKLHDSQLYDLTGAQGFANAICLSLKLFLGGSCNTAPVCSSWTFMNSGTSRRSRSLPLGDVRIPSIRNANQMVSRMVLLMYLLVARTIFVLWEQPKGSVMEAHPRFQEFLHFRKLHRAFARLWDFGGESEKGLWLYSPYNWVSDIEKYTTGPKDLSMRKLPLPFWEV